MNPITTEYLADAIERDPSGAIFSEDRVHRYVLWRRVESPQLDMLAPAAQGICAFCMLNPSNADELILDPTVTRVIGFCRSWGFRTMIVVNMFAYRSTDPKGLLGGHDIIGPDNDDWLEVVGKVADRKVVAWGGGIAGLDVEPRAHEVLRIFGSDVLCLGTTKISKMPLHPLYIAGSTQPIPYEGAA